VGRQAPRAAGAVLRRTRGSARYLPRRLRTEELQFLTEWRWWTADEIAQSDAVCAPRTLAKILPAILDSQYPEQPIALPG